MLFFHQFTPPSLVTWLFELLSLVFLFDKFAVWEAQKSPIFGIQKNSNSEILNIINDERLYTLLAYWGGFVYVIAIFSKQYAWEVGGRLAAILITYIASESLHNVTFVAKGNT